MALRISLRDGEKIIVNGAVLRAAGRTDLCIENNVTLLRGRDVMSPEEANTPARRLYFACMMAYIDSADQQRHQDAIVTLVQALMEALESPEAKAVCISFAQKVATSDFYRALADCRWLIDYEAEAMARPVATVA
ncbi:flagellar biosynthesis repressor FlbT [Sphingomonas fennica]|uniref:Flagellar biosynthesis repressor FlbT n=1 Tax=Edaphosphingomonas fennica TaxID=114404 RepID=A0A2T4HPJ8_9SPHN|nr:flagellar biosynthesis repressor FlbT [Sphingomonas fennica]PTD17696.1 flagellar biosynthesis repressor FlbT [Sphingomonas fennica]